MNLKTTSIAQADPVQLISDAMKDAVNQATEDAARAQERIRKMGLDIAHLASRCAYTPFYMISYGIVYATLFVAKSIPQGNPMVEGLIDGGRAAIDAVNGDKSIKPAG